MRLKALHSYALLVFSLGLYAFLHFGIQRIDLVGESNLSAFLQPALVFAGLILAYLWLLSGAKDRHSEQAAWWASIAIRLMLVFCLPNFSDDFYRFVWDGKLSLLGQNPFDLLPSEWLAQLPAASLHEWQPLFDKLNSQHYYSVYPPVLQGVFAFGVWIGKGDVWTSIVAMKALVFLAEIGSLHLIRRILLRWQLPERYALVYALNPLVIMELMGNLHFEALMIFFFLAAFWLLMVRGPLLAAPFMALSIGAKLLPVLVFPFLIKRLGWRRWWLFSGLTALACLLIFGSMLDWENLGHFQESIKLYFQKFEFNGGIYYLIRKPLEPYGYWVNRILPWLCMAAILYLAWKEKNRIWQGLPSVFLLALGMYQLQSPVVHPWYIAPLVALSALGNYRAAVLWSLLIPFTYIAYYYPQFSENHFLIAFEYVLVLGMVLYEWHFKRNGLHLDAWMLQRPWFRKWMKKSIPARLRIKEERIANALLPGHKLLEIGAGHGGLCLALRKRGFEVEAVDVKDISYFEELRPIIYDGQTLPFEDKSFDCAMMITMLHHTPDPELILREALRVSRSRLVVMEDVYRNPLQKYLTFFTDSLANMEFEGHPHTNRSDQEWQETFARMGLNLVKKEEFRTLVFFRQVIYVLEIGSEPVSAS